MKLIQSLKKGKDERWNRDSKVEKPREDQVGKNSGCLAAAKEINWRWRQSEEEQLWCHIHSALQVQIEGNTKEE